MICVDVNLGSKHHLKILHRFALCNIINGVDGFRYLLCDVALQIERLETALQNVGDQADELRSALQAANQDKGSLTKETVIKQKILQEAEDKV